MYKKNVFRVTEPWALEDMRSISSIAWGPIWPYSFTATGVNVLRELLATTDA